VAYNYVQQSTPQTITFSSGTGRQVSTSASTNVLVPFTLNPTGIATATVVVAISPDNVTYTTVTTITAPAVATLAGLIPAPIAIPNLPTGWYVKLTATNATLATGTWY
jgi:hypothetical protein